MTCGIYEIKNRLTGEMYIGQSKNIESRWGGHKCAPSRNMMPLMKLYETTPENVEFKIIKTIPQNLFSNDELGFILSVYENNELEKRGGVNGENILNVQPIHIPPVSPSILMKPDSIPSFVDNCTLLNSIKIWYSNYERGLTIDKMCYQDKVKKFESLYFSQAYDLHQLENEINSLNQQLEKVNTTSTKDYMASEYEVFKLKKEIRRLNDENEELSNNVVFWKEKCAYWRNLYQEE